MIVRQAEPRDASAMCDLLNRIIALGGTTAHQTPFDTTRMQNHFIAHPHGISCHVAEIENQIAGFQSLEWAKGDDDPMPSGWAIIASFVDARFAGQGAGKALMAATVKSGQVAGVTTIDATIRADNTSGLGYYSAMGFTDYDMLRQIPLADGTRVDRVRKRRDI